MYSVPFHRRILPWVFALILLIMAPAVIFYTSGYRWNSKKGVIERNGTLIIDTIPTGATISLNGQEQPIKTPSTMQNVSPGTYTITLTKPGYHSWSKSLSIDPERVTFATNINLWPVSEPELINQGNAKYLLTDSKAQKLMIYYQDSDSNARFVLQNPDNKEVLSSMSISDKVAVTGVTWDSSSAQALVYDSIKNQSWLLETAASRATKLPAGFFHWDQSKITALTPTEQIAIDKNGTLEKIVKENDLWDQLDGFKLKKLPNADNLVLVAKNHETEGTLLPPGNWVFMSADSNSIVLHDGDNWLWINNTQNKTSSSQASGQWMYGLTIKRLTNYVYKNNNEVWIWTQGSNPILIYRQTEPIVQVAWHSEGNDIMVATEKDVRMYNLDDRNGRFETVLASFDSISDATVVKDNIFVAGTKNNISGVYRIQLTTPKTASSLLDGLKF